MKNIFLILFCIVFFSCTKKREKEIPVEKIKIKQIVAPVQLDDKLLFMVQIAALKNVNKTLTNLENIKIFQENTLIKYRFGAFKTYKEARERRAQLIKNYKGAFVQALLNDTPISITAALQH